MVVQLLVDQLLQPLLLGLELAQLKLSPPLSKWTTKWEQGRMPSIRKVRWAMGCRAGALLSFYASFASASTGSFFRSRGGSETINGFFDWINWSNNDWD